MSKTSKDAFRSRGPEAKRLLRTGRRFVGGRCVERDTTVSTVCRSHIAAACFWVESNLCSLFFF